MHCACKRPPRRACSSFLSLFLPRCFSEFLVCGTSAMVWHPTDATRWMRGSIDRQHRGARFRATAQASKASKSGQS